MGENFERIFDQNLVVQSHCINYESLNWNAVANDLRNFN